MVKTPAKKSRPGARPAKTSKPARHDANKPAKKGAGSNAAPEQAEAGESRNRRTMEQLILDLCAASSRSIDPVRVARTFAEDRGDTDPMAWRRWLHQVRSTAIGMARKGDLLIMRKGKPADPEDFRGVYRLALPGAAVTEADVDTDDDETDMD